MQVRNARVLIAEGDPLDSSGLQAALRRQGFEVRAERNASQAHEATRTFAPDLVLVDLRRDDGEDGVAVVRRLRERSDLPVVLVTSADRPDERLAGFGAGADDCVPKPVEVDELVARVRALLRRTGRPSGQVWRVEDLTVDEGAHTAARAGQAIDLTSLEFALLVALCRRPGRVVGKSQLLAEVWGFEDYAPNVVEVRISRLRAKLERHGPRLLHTVRGVGYTVRG